MTEPTETEETRLRRAFALIGDEAGRPDLAASVRTVPAAARPPRGRRRVRAALAVTAAVCTATIIVTVAVTADGGSGTDTDTTGRGQTFPQALACANAVVEGDLTAVRPTGQGRIQVTMSVDRWFKPSAGPATARFDLAAPAVADPAEAYADGDHLLLLVPRRKGQIPDTYQGQELKPMRDRITRTLPEAAHTTCPPEFR
ncbi:hypothetical protein [Streptomyces sp. DASNCL29]|uniref:hypothetical protein n=1 Tax=Streptomyces sp. DASNCL29 TaxID=2583819 RepID=UPI00110F9C47|nr:hypothetical protein [Streptomyces sp. DASNCL29]TMU89874.1 hypothetical protein FGK60_40290 [Streptomyces sp. DASNCL29]